MKTIGEYTAFLIAVAAAGVVAANWRYVRRRMTGGSARITARRPRG